uniref:C-type lectin domain-containing protein n=1 Tax=Oryzias melastigma TaxID=30732 RepID=A0A3B3CZL8_ORYME
MICSSTNYSPAPKPRPSEWIFPFWLWVESVYNFPCLYHYVNQPLNWTEAQTYCRQKHTDLATIETSEEMDQVRNIVSSTGFIWIGLYSNINWRWSDGFIGGLTGNNYWTLEDSFDSRSDQICMVADWSSSNRLFESSCSSLLPFVCSNGKNAKQRCIVEY